ncbi:MAG TPA: amino acid ABC transporter substrate-binding protein [Casimicrobiaceae bacterium]|nr:amino acid ABC transporter substrate-binding protein [Casimicrobiaceae bacterium]
MRGLRCLGLFTGVCVAAYLWLAVALAGAAEPSPTLARIKADATIRLGYRSGAAPFSFKERDGRVRGYSAELCTHIAAALQKRLALPGLKVEWVPLDADTRLDAVAAGRADIECGTTTISLSRYEKVDFSLPIFIDGGSLMVQESAKIERFADLDGKTIAVIPGTTTERGLKRQLAVTGAKARMVAVKDGAEGVRSLAAGKVDAYASDRIVLIGLRSTASEPEKLRLLDSDFSFEPYALVVRRDDPDFRLAVNRALVEIYRSGEIDPIFHRWLGGLGEPSPLLNAMFYLSTLPE